MFFIAFLGEISKSAKIMIARVANNIIKNIFKPDEMVGVWLRVVSSFISWFSFVIGVVEVWVEVIGVLSSIPDVTFTRSE